ncbi:MAG: response regulator [Chloroflexi bacterium]|nr:response regulator [Chloroflexota bacterium]
MPGCYYGVGWGLVTKRHEGHGRGELAMGGASRVLLVGDEPGFADAEFARLLREGFQVDVAHGGPQAAALCADGRYDVALVDSRKPDADGLETLRLLRRAAPAIRTILIAGHERADMVHLAIREGVEAVFHRPADAASFLPLFLT